MAEDRPTSTVYSEYATPPQSLLALDTMPLGPPRASFFSPGPSIGGGSSRESRALSATIPEADKEDFTPAQSATLLQTGKDSESPPSRLAARTAPFYRRPVWLAIALGTLVVLVLAIVLPVTLTHKSNGQSNKLGSNSGSGTGSSGNPSPTGNPKTSSNATSGGDGSTIISGNTSFTYSNPYGGFCEFLLISIYFRIWGAWRVPPDYPPCMRALASYMRAFSVPLYQGVPNSLCGV
jgi:hypothetical protein